MIVDEDAITLTNGRRLADWLEPRPRHPAQRSIVRRFPWWFRLLPRFARAWIAPSLLK